MREVARRWPIVFCAAISVCVALLPSYTFGALAQPLAAHFKRPISDIMLWTAFWSIGAILASPAVGWLADRIAPRILIATGLLFHAAALAIAAFVGGELWAFYLCATLIGVTATASGSIPCGRLIAGNFDRSLGLALGLMASGIGLAALGGPRLIQWTVDLMNWRFGYFVLASAALICAPISFFAAKKTRSVRVDRAPEVGDSLRDAIRKPEFLLVSVGVLLFGMTTGGAAVNLMPVLSELGVTRGEAAGYLGAFGLATTVARLVVGLMLDLLPFHVGWTMAASLALMSAGLFLLPHVGWLWLALLLLGFATGSEVDCLAYALVRMFGRRAYGSIYGIIGVGILYTGTGIGPFLLSRLGAEVGGLAKAFPIWGGLSLCAACVFTIVTLRPYRFPALPRTNLSIQSEIQAAEVQ